MLPERANLELNEEELSECLPPGEYRPAAHAARRMETEIRNNPARPSQRLAAISAAQMLGFAKGLQF